MTDIIQRNFERFDADNPQVYSRRLGEATLDSTSTVPAGEYYRGAAE